ncbi:MAG: MFS transporter [Erysipelotrichaceae bacterium]
MTNKVDEKGVRKFGLLDKISYAAGDFGCNMSFALAGIWFTLFWTQYMKIDSLVFAGLLIALKIWDAINDPLIGTYMDASNKNYKLGKFKHFINVGSYGLAISAALCFLPVPEASETVKIILCLIGYVAWDAFYTVVNVPYGSMLSVITADPGERAQLGAWRNLGAMAAAIPMGVFLPMILYDEQRNIMGTKLFATALILGFIGWLAFKFMIKTTVQRVETPAPEENVKFNVLQSIKDFMRNRPALGATLMPVSMFLGSYGAATATTVMFQSYFQNTKISGLLSLVVVIPMLLFIPFVKKITVKYGKKEASAFGMIFSIAACVAMLIVPIKPDTSGILIYMVLQLINGLGMGFGNIVGNAMMADAIDYNQWKTGKREEGITYSLHSFFRKAAQGIGPSIGLVLMVMLGYNEQLGAGQPFEVAVRMRYLVAVLYLFSAVLMYIGVKYIYNLDKETLKQMNKELGR